MGLGEMVGAQGVFCFVFEVVALLGVYDGEAPILGCNSCISTVKDAVPLLRTGNIRVYSHVVRVVQTSRVLQQAGCQTSSNPLLAQDLEKAMSSTRISPAHLGDMNRAIDAKRRMLPEN
jgi:hypothetical protein